MFKFRKYLFLTAAILACGAGPAYAAPIAAGQVWALDDARGPVLQFNDCNGKLCAALVALGPDSVAPRDIHNPSPALRSRPLCGLNVITGLAQTPKGLTGGTIYDPQAGKTYQMRIDDGGAKPKIVIAFGPFSASMALLLPAGVLGKCPA